MARVMIQSFGCSASMSDGEIMAGILEGEGHELVERPSLADVIIINTCVVKGKTESHMKRLIKEYRSKHKKAKLVVAGCMPQAGLVDNSLGVSMIGPHDLDKIGHVVGSALLNKQVIAISEKTMQKAGIAKKSSNNRVRIVQILEGCSGACAYCIVKRVKPILYSFPEAEIIKDVEDGLKEGAKEIWLTSQDNASYGLDMASSKGKSRLPGLIKKISALEGDFLIRVGMMNPDTIASNLDDLIEAFSSPKVYKFLHIPIQSGSDAVLKSMNRKYTNEQFQNVVASFRKKYPQISISTDIIVGFPGELDSDFKESLSTLKELKPDVLNLSRFMPRPGTVAEKMKNQVHGSITKERSEIMAKAFLADKARENKKWVAWEGDVLINEVGKKGTRTMVGRNYCYKAVVVSGGKSLLGKTLKIRIRDTSVHYLSGDIII